MQHRAFRWVKVRSSDIWTGAAMIGLAMSVGGAPASAQSETSVQTKQYETGGVYEGEFLDGKQHGTGKYTLPNGYEYQGQWVEGRIEGQGQATFPNGSVYNGTFVNGRPSGEGKIVFSDGGTYEGSWTDGTITGQGVAVYANGVRYEGDFKNAVHDGIGTMTAPSGYVYEGAWVNGTKEGRGKITYPDGAIYEGDVRSGVREGHRHAHHDGRAHLHRRLGRRSDQRDGCPDPAERRPLRGKLRERAPRWSGHRVLRQRRHLRGHVPGRQASRVRRLQGL